MNPEEQMVPVAGAEVCVQSYGAPTDPCLLLVAGAGCAMDWWDDALCERLAVGGRRVVRYDHRDTGRSTTDPVGEPTYGASALVDDCIAVATRLGPDPVHLVGLSRGGGIAQSVALRRPELVASLTLCSTSPVGGVDDPLPGPAPRVSAAFEDEPPAPDWPGWLEVDLLVRRLVDAERPFAGDLGFDEDRVHAVARRVVERSRDIGAAQNHWLVLGVDSSAALDVHDISVPTLVLHGSSDPLFPLEHGRALAGAVPGASLVVLDGVGHQYPPPSTWHVVVEALLAHTTAPAGRAP